MLLRRVTCGSLSLLALLFLTGGCGGGDEFVKSGVKGNVSLDGQPLAQGRIFFEPSAGSSGQTASATITNGAFEILAKDGVSVGNNIVRINSNKPTGKKVKSAMSGEMLDETTEGIPEKYNTKSTLEKEIIEGANELDFDLKS